MLAEREEALGKVHLWPDLENSQQAWVYSSLDGQGNRGVRAAQKLTALTLRVLVMTLGTGVVLGHL